jgi:uncharacterized protein (DUF1330 family)
MAKGYWIVRSEVSDPEQYQKYIAANAEPLSRFGAKFLVRGGPYDCVEGATSSRNIVLEFPTIEAARACYRDAGYQHAKSLRDGAAELDIVIIEGYSGPQPGE